MTVDVNPRITGGCTNTVLEYQSCYSSYTEKYLYFIWFNFMFFFTMGPLKPFSIQQWEIVILLRTGIYFK